MTAEALAPPEEGRLALFPFQETGVHRLVSSDSLLLADEMGLGKTIQVIAALRELASQGRIEKALVVAPASLIPQWREQMRLWAPELRFSTVRGPAHDRSWQWRAPAVVYLTSYETLRADFSMNPHAPIARAWDVVVLDEASRIRNAENATSQDCKALSRRRAWALTGTPLENSVDDLASLLEFVQPRTDGFAAWQRTRGADLMERLAAVQLRRRKRDVLTELPPRMYVDVPLELSGPQRKAYDRAEREGIVRLRELGAAVRVENVLELILRLKQICNFCPETGASIKMDDLIDRLHAVTEAGERALVFSQFVGAPFGIRAIESRLRPFRPLVFAGDTPPDVRERTLQAFKSDSSHAALLLSLKAGGQGLNLQEASYVFHFDRWWNPAVERQAEDRVHRMGQTLPVTVYRYTCADTIEERIEEVLREKRALFDAVVDDEWDESRLSKGELLALFGLSD